MSLRQNELVWVRVRLEGECFWVNLRQDNKVSESKMAVAESNMAEFKMAAIIKLIRMNEWCFFCKMAETKLGEFKWSHHQVEWEWMSLSQNELVWVRVRVEGNVFEWIWEKKTRCLNSTMQKLNPRWQNSQLQNLWWPPSSGWVRLNEFESDWISLNQSQSRRRVFLSESERIKQRVWIPKCRSDSKIAEFQIAMPSFS